MIQFILALILTSPLGLDWTKPLSDAFREVPGYRYIYGNPNLGYFKYLGTIEGYEAELQLESSSSFLYRATLIIGPGGLNEINCIDTYRFFQGLLVEKYGPNFTRTIRTDPVIDDLLYVHKCHAVRIGVETISTIWDLSDFLVELDLFGDDEIYIEITYTHKKQKKNIDKAQRKKLLKGL